MILPLLLRKLSNKCIKKPAVEYASIFLHYSRQPQTTKKSGLKTI